MRKEEKDKIIMEALSLLKDANERDVTNYRIAADTDITEATIGNYINGKSRPTFANAKILISYFKGNVGEISLQNIHLGNIPADVITISKKAWSIIEMQAKSLEKKDDQIDELIKMLKDQKGVAAGVKTVAPKEAQK